MLDERGILQTYLAFRHRYEARDERYDKIVDVLNKDWELRDSNGEDMNAVSSNNIGVALADTAEASATMPTIRVRPRKVTAMAKAEAALMEQIATGYFDDSQIDVNLTRFGLDLGAYGLAPLVVLPDPQTKRPYIDVRDPRLCFPEPMTRPGDLPRRVLFARELHLSQLSPMYQEMVRPTWETLSHQEQETSKVVMVEYYSEEEITVAALISQAKPYTVDKPELAWHPVLLDQIPNRLGICPVVPMSRITWDKEFRGQFDDAVDPQMALARLQAMRVDYADQSVYSDVWARDVIGEMPMGGGSFIELGPNGAIGRVPPAVSSLDLWRDMEQMEDQIHLSGRWPKSRPGQIDQAIASGKFLEATVGMMSTVIKSNHLVLARGLAQALRLCFATDLKYFGGTEKKVVGVTGNQQFTVAYTPRKDISLDHRIDVEYGLGLGRDANSSAVLMMNYAKEEYISHEFVQENIDGLTDVERERKRIDLQKVRQMMLAKLLQAMEQGELPPDKLSEIYEAREKGQDLAAIFKDIFAPPEEPPAADPLAMLGLPGLPGGAGPPGAPPGAPLPPGAPGELPMPPPPPEAAQMLARIGADAGPAGSALGTQVMG